MMRAYWRDATNGGSTYCDACGLRLAGKWRRAGEPQRAPYLVPPDAPAYGSHPQVCESCGCVAHDSPGYHWHYEYGIAGYLPNVVCLHDGSRNDALTYLRDEIRDYVDNYACHCYPGECDGCELDECTPDRFTPTEWAVALSAGVSDAEIRDMPEWVEVNEYDHARVCLVLDSDCECHADYMRDPHDHECYYD